jgi:hypothetical protein
VKNLDAGWRVITIADVQARKILTSSGASRASAKTPQDDLRWEVITISDVQARKILRQRRLRMTFK